MPSAAQRVIVISISTNRLPVAPDKPFKCRYSYLSPVTGLVHMADPKCDLLVNEPTNCLFVLDFLTAKDGWKIDSISSTPSSTLLESIAGPLNQSILVINPYINDPTGQYHYYIHYNRPDDNQFFKEDPQEGNGPPPPSV
jgi:hypothetical protein